MRHAVGGGWAFEENKGRSVYAKRKRLLVDPILFPESEGFVLQFRKLDIRLYSLKHDLKNRGQMKRVVRTPVSCTTLRVVIL